MSMNKTKPLISANLIRELNLNDLIRYRIDYIRRLMLRCSIRRCRRRRTSLTRLTTTSIYIRRCHRRRRRYWRRSTWCWRCCIIHSHVVREIKSWRRRGRRISVCARKTSRSTRIDLVGFWTDEYAIGAWYHALFITKKTFNYSV